MCHKYLQTRRIDLAVLQLVISLYQAPISQFFLSFYFLLYSKKGGFYYPKSFTYISRVNIIFLGIGLLNNKPEHIAKDFALVAMQILFLILGYSLAIDFIKERLIQHIVAINLVISVILGLSVINTQTFDIVSPIFGFQALALFGALAFKKWTHTLLFFLTLMSGVVFWGFGKQSALYSLVLLAIWVFRSLGPSSATRTTYSFGFKQLGFTIIALLVLWATVNITTSSGIEKKTQSFFQNLDLYYISSSLSVDTIYLAFDDSTAGRLVEYILISEKMSSSIIFTMFGSGLGGALDLSIKNQYAGLASFTFSNTQGVQTLPAFILLKGGVLGSFLFAYFCRALWSLRKYEGDLVVLSAAIVFLSVLAFPTVIRFHFLFYFIGVTLALAQKKAISQIDS